MKEKYKNGIIEIPRGPTPKIKYSGLMPKQSKWEKKLEMWLYRIEDETVADNIEYIVEKLLSQEHSNTLKESIKRLQEDKENVRGSDILSDALIGGLDLAINHLKQISTIKL